MKKKNNSSQLVTKDFLESKLNELKEENKIYHDEILTKLDGIAGELGEMRDENIIGAGQTSQLNDTVDNHEKRIKNLEKISQTA